MNNKSGSVVTLIPYSSIAPMLSQLLPRLAGSCLSLPGLRSSSSLQHFLCRDVLHKLVLIHEECRSRFTLAEKLFCLIVPVPALFMIALAERNDRIRLWGIRQHHNLC